MGIILYFGGELATLQKPVTPRLRVTVWPQVRNFEAAPVPADKACNCAGTVADNSAYYFSILLINLHPIWLTNGTDNGPGVVKYSPLLSGMTMLPCLIHCSIYLVTQESPTYSYST